MISKKFIIQNKLHTPCKLYHSRSAIQFVLNDFPELELSPRQFKNDKVPSGYWTKEENRIGALKSFLEEQMGWNTDGAKEKLSWNVLEENGLGSLHNYYPSLYKVFKAVYKVDIRPWELMNSEVPSGTWEDRNSRIMAIDWLLNKINYEIDKADRKTFAKYGLGKLLADYYGDNAKRAVKKALHDKSYDKLDISLRL